MLLLFRFINFNKNLLALDRPIEMREIKKEYQQLHPQLGRSQLHSVHIYSSLQLSTATKRLRLRIESTMHHPVDLITFRDRRRPLIELIQIQRGLQFLASSS